MINVTKTFLPPQKEYDSYLSKIWESRQLTNQGPLLREFERKAKDYIGVKNFQFVANGTLALQVALKSLSINEGEIITTPFTYVATVSAILWERCTPVFVDIEPDTLCIDPEQIENAITPKTKAILAVHVFGFPCAVDAIESIAKKHNIKVIYDGAHAFGVKQNGVSLLDHGDISICSFHATKPFHTIEGGCVITRDDRVGKKAELIKRFGHEGDNHYMLGINAKASEFNAAMGLCNLKYVDDIIEKRKKITELYDTKLTTKLQRPKPSKGTQYNYAYYPVIFESEEKLLKAVKKLNSQNIFPRRYFYPSLHQLPYTRSKQNCPVAEDIAKKVLCLPLYSDLESKSVAEICEIINTHGA